MTQERDVCRWTLAEETEWDTDCGQTFCLNDDGPADNDMRFCCYCGKSLEEVPFRDDAAVVDKRI